MGDKELNPDFIFLHGYTGGPTDFADLPERLVAQFGGTSYCPLLPGHGTKVENLVGLHEDTILAPITTRIERSLHEGRPVVLVGLSFGAQAALSLATRYTLAGVVAMGTTHKLLFPFNLPGAGLLRHVKHIWKKRFTTFELQKRVDAVFYDAMPFDGYFISRRLSNALEAGIDEIRCPVLFLHSAHEKLGDPRALPVLKQKISARVDIALLDDENHAMLFSDSKDDIIRRTLAFVADAHMFGKPSGEKATAIVPAYNEGPRIGAVLAALSQAASIGQVIVVDDGSTDNTRAEVAAYPGVTYLHNERNLGKAASLGRGVDAAENDVVFFCDADLRGFKPEHAEAIVRPVLERHYDMYIGTRGNVMQRTVHAWALNSGERALRKELWHSLPRYYKHRYRIEAGLNRLAKATGRKWGWKELPYSQPLKESKYGFVRGTLLRWWMNFDIICAYVSYPFLNWLSK